MSNRATHRSGRLRAIPLVILTLVPLAFVLAFVITALAGILQHLRGLLFGQVPGNRSRESVVQAER